MGAARRLITMRAARNGKCYDKFGVKRLPNKTGRIGGAPHYEEMSKKTEAKVNACIKKLDDAELEKRRIKRRLITMRAARNGKCYDKFGVKRLPNKTGRIG